MTQFSSLVLRHLGEASLLADRLDEAAEFAGQVLTLARERGQRSNEAWTLRLLGEIASHRDPPYVVQAEHDYGEALSLATELGMRPLVAHCHLGLGNLYRRTGDHAKAHEHLTTATAMYREMGMAFWLTKAEQEAMALG